MALNIGANGNIILQSDQQTFIHFTAFSGAGAMVPVPGGDVDTVAATGTFAASLSFAMGVMPAGDPLAGQPAVVCTPLVLESDPGNAGGNIGLTVTDSAGLVQAVTKFFDISPDAAAVRVGLDMTDSAVVSQTAPTAPGP
jgi:hypothetical protein